MEVKSQLLIEASILSTHLKFGGPALLVFDLTGVPRRLAEAVKNFTRIFSDCSEVQKKSAMNILVPPYRTDPMLVKLSLATEFVTNSVILAERNEETFYLWEGKVYMVLDYQVFENRRIVNGSQVELKNQKSDEPTCLELQASELTEVENYLEKEWAASRAQMTPTIVEEEQVIVSNGNSIIFGYSDLAVIVSATCGGIVFACAGHSIITENLLAGFFIGAGGIHGRLELGDNNKSNKMVHLLQLGIVRLLFDEVSERDLASWNVMRTEYVKQGKMEGTMKFLNGLSKRAVVT